MSYSRRSRYSPSPSPPRRRYSRSYSRSRSSTRSRSYDSSDIENPGNNLYVTGLSPRISKRDLEKHFSTEGKVEDVHLVVDPWTRESRGFGFVTMSGIKEADRCIKYLDGSVLEGRVITVEKARRRRGRTPTPGRYLGLRTVRVRRRSPTYSPYSSRSPRHSSERDRSRSRSYSTYYSSRRGRSRSRSYSPYYSSRRRRSYSLPYSRGRSYSRTSSPYGRSPVCRRDRYCSPEDCYYRRTQYYSRDYSPDYRRSYRSSSRGRRYRSVLRSVSSSPRRHYRSCSPSMSPSRRSYSRSISPRPRRSYSGSVTPRSRRSSRNAAASRCRSPSRSYSRSPSASPSSRSMSRSPTPRSASH